MTTKHLLLAILVAAIWGFNFIFVKLGTDEIPPLFLGALRFFFASVPAIFFVKWPATSFKLVALYGLVTFGLQFSLLFTSFTVGMTAGMASLLMQTQIFFSIFFAVFFLGERPTRQQLLGALVAFSGIALIAWHLDQRITLSGFLLVIGGAAAWGLGNLIAKRIGQVNMIGLIVWGSFISCPALFFVSFLIEGQKDILQSLMHFTWLGVVSLAYIVYLSTWLGYGLWNWLLSRYSVSSVVPFTLLVPLFGILSAVLIMGESFEPWKIASALLVLMGLCINLLGPYLRKKSYK